MGACVSLTLLHALETLPPVVLCCVVLSYCHPLKTWSFLRRKQSGSELGREERYEVLGRVEGWETMVTMYYMREECAVNNNKIEPL